MPRAPFAATLARSESPPRQRNTQARASFIRFVHEVRSSGSFIGVVNNLRSSPRLAACARRSRIAAHVSSPSLCRRARCRRRDVRIEHRGRRRPRERRSRLRGGSALRRRRRRRLRRVRVRPRRRRVRLRRSRSERVPRRTGALRLAKGPRLQRHARREYVLRRQARLSRRHVRDAVPAPRRLRLRRRQSLRAAGQRPTSLRGTGLYGVRLSPGLHVRRREALCRRLHTRREVPVRRALPGHQLHRSVRLGHVRRRLDLSRRPVRRCMRLLRGLQRLRRRRDVRSFVAGAPLRRADLRWRRVRRRLALRRRRVRRRLRRSRMSAQARLREPRERRRRAARRMRRPVSTGDVSAAEGLRLAHRRLPRPFLPRGGARTGPGGGRRG